MRHVIFILFYPNEQRRGCMSDFFFCSLFPVQQTTSGIGHSVNRFLRVGTTTTTTTTTNTLNVMNNNKQQQTLTTISALKDDLAKNSPNTTQSMSYGK